MEIQSGFSIIRPEQAPQRGQPERVGGRETTTAERVERVEEAKAVRANVTDDVLNSAKKFQQQTGYDQPEGKGRDVVAAYQSLDREAQRDNIRQLLGVDLYA